MNKFECFTLLRSVIPQLKMEKNYDFNTEYKINITTDTSTVVLLGVLNHNIIYHHLGKSYWAKYKLKWKKNLYLLIIT